MTQDSLTLTLDDGHAMPRIGLGTYKVPGRAAEALVRGAIDVGYRAIDTAAMYGNESQVGAAVRAAPERIFVTTKLWMDDLGRDATLRAFDTSMERLGLDMLDLYLIHWPAPARELYVETWPAFVELRAQGRVRSIGVSNFAAAQLERIIGETGVAPAVNQIELHPRFQQAALRDFNAAHGIATISWAPLGRGAMLDDPVIACIAARHGRTPAQIVLRWHLQLGLIAIPKSSSRERQAANIDLAGFTLDAEDMAAIAALDDPGGRTGPDPETFGG